MGANASARCPVIEPGAALQLQQAISRALCNDPRTRQSWAELQAKTAELQLQRSRAWPTVSAGLGVGQARQRLNEDATVTVNKAGVGSAALELSWVLADFGQQRASEDAARWAVTAASAAHDDTLMEVALTTASAYFRLAEAEATQQVLRQDSRFTGDFLMQRARPAQAAAQAPVVVGRGGTAKRQAQAPKPQPGEEKAIGDELELLQLRADQSRAAMERRVARGNLLQARGALAIMLGVQPQHDLRTQTDDDGRDGDVDTQAIETLLQEVLRDHPALRAARARLGAAGAELELARRTDAPRLALQHSQRVGRDVLRSYSRESTIGLQLEVPLFAGQARKHREAQAQAQLEAARAGLLGTEQQVAAQTWAAYQALQTYSAAWGQAKAYEADARALLNGELASYRAGNSDLHDVLDAQGTVSEAAMARLSSLTALRLARVQLATMLGRLHHTAPPAAESAPR